MLSRVGKPVFSRPMFQKLPSVCIPPFSRQCGSLASRAMCVDGMLVRVCGVRAFILYSTLRFSLKDIHAFILPPSSVCLLLKSEDPFSCLPVPDLADHGPQNCLRVCIPPTLHQVLASFTVTITVALPPPQTGVPASAFHTYSEMHCHS